MIHSLNSAHLIQEEFRGEPATDIDQLAQMIVDVSSFCQSNESIVSIDINPVIISEGQPIGVDALVEVGQPYNLNNNSPMPDIKQLKEK